MGKKEEHGMLSMGPKTLFPEKGPMRVGCIFMLFLFLSLFSSIHIHCLDSISEGLGRTFTVKDGYTSTRGTNELR